MPTYDRFPEWMRIFFISGIALVCDVATLMGFVRVFHIHYLVSAVVAFAVGLMVNYTLSVRWGFSQRKWSSPTSSQYEFLVFCVIGMIGAGWNDLILWILVGRLAWPFLLSKGVSAVLVFGWNYGVRKAILF